MADNDNRRKLYDNINKEYDLPDYDQFSKDMEDDTKRKRLYDAVAKEYDLPDYNKFSQDMGYGQQEVQTSNPQNVQQSAQIPQKPQAQQPLQPQQTATVDSRNAEKSYDEQKAANDEQFAETYNKLAKEGRVRMGIENHPNVKMVAVTDELIKKFPILEQSRGYQVPFDMNYGTPIMQNLNDKGDIITPDEAREQYTKILTNQDFDYVPQQETAAVQVGNVIKTSISPKGGWLDNITKGSLEYAYGKDWRDKKYEVDGKEVSANDMYARTKQELYDDINTEIGNIRHSLLFATDEQKKETVDQLYEKGYLKEEILPKGTVLHYIMNVGKDEQLEELKQRRTKAQVQKEMVMDKLKKIPQPDHGETMAEFYTRTAQDGSELYQSDLRKLDKQINQYDAVIDELEGRNSSSREWGHAVKTSGITQLGAWDFGITDLKDAMLMYPLARKVENGENITQDDYTSLKLLSQANDADAVEGALMPSSYNIKKGGLVSAPFTLQFMAGGEFAKGATTMADKAIARTVKGAIYKAAGKKALSAAERLAEKAASNKMLSLVGMLGKDFRQAFFMENTTGAATTGAEILNRRNGTVTETGDGFDWQGETLPMAIYKGEMSQNIELQTEFLGEHFPSSLKFIRGMAHTKVGSAMGLRNMAAWLSKLSRKDLANTIRSYATKGGINGLWGEYMEEVAGTAENAIFIGDQKLSDLVDAKQQWETFGSVALSCIGMGIFGTAVYTGQRGLNMPRYYQMKHLQNKWENTAMDLFSGDEWAQMKEKIDNTPNENAGELLSSIVRDQKLTEQQARAAFNYARCMLTLRGMNIGTMKAAQLGLTDDKTIEQDQSYVEGRETSDEDKHDVQIEYEDKTKELAGMLGISEQQLANMSDEELESLTGNDDKLDNVIYDYQNAHAKYQGVMDTADDNIDMAAQQAAQQTDMATDKSRGTVRNATIKSTKGEEDYGVYIVSGNVATNEDGSINISESDNMILYYDPQSGKIEHADASRFAAVGEEVNAEEAKNQAIADAKEKAIRKEAGIIDGTVGEGSSFTITDAEGNEHTYEVLADNGDGTAMITLDGNVQDAPASIEDLQKLKDVEDAKKLEAAKLERQQLEDERKQKKEQEGTPVEDNLDYSEVINNDGKIEIADVMNENGTSMFPDAQEVFFIQNQGNRAKVMVLDNEGNLRAKMVKKSAVVSLGTMSVDEYKEERQQMLKESGKGSETSSVEEDRGEEENLQPIGQGAFGNIYNQFKGKVKEAFNFLISHKSGDLLGVFHRDDVGDIDLVWGNDKMGLAHIIGKHIGKGKDFENIDDAIKMIDEVINKGGLIQDTDNRYVISLNGFRVGIRKNFDGTKKNWIVTAIDYNRSKEEKGIATNPTSASHGVEGSELAAPNDSQGKGTSNESNKQENSEKITLEDGTEVPMKEDGNPDFSQLTAKQTAELYDTQFGEDAEQIISDNVKKSKNALDKANNMTVKGGSFVEQKASKEAKDKAIAEAQEKYNSAKAVADAFNERMLAKEEDTPEGRQNLIEKARRKFNRMKSSVKDNAQAVAQLYNDTVGSLLHRLYDGTGIDVFDDTANTIEEYVASHIAPYSLSYDGTETSKGVKQETGLSRTDFAKTGFLAKEGKGKTIDKLAHDLWQERPENLQDITDQDVRNAIIDIITSGETAFGLRNYIQDMRIAQAERVLEGQKQQADELAYAEERKAKEEEQQPTENTDNDMEGNSETSDDADTAPSDDAAEDNNSEMPFDAPSADDAPFSAKDETEEQSSEERQAFVEKNRVNDIKLVDDVIGKKLRKSLERIAKMMGAKIQWQRTDKIGNGWFNSDTNTIYLTLDSSITEGVQFIFGHEMTHEIKTKSPAMYDELKSLVKDRYGEDLYEGMTDDNEQKYTDAGIAGYDRSYYEEETVADAIGDMMNDLNLAHSLALKMSHPLLAQVHNVLLKVKTAFFGTEYSDAARNAIRTIEQVYVRTANGTFESSESEETNDEQFSVREANERFNNELSRYQNGEMAKNEILHLGNPQGVMRIFLPDLPVVMRQRIIKKGSEKKHDVDVSAIMNMPERLSSPLFVFQRSENTIGVLTDMIDRSGKNVCVAIELKRQIQQGAEYLEVNDVRSFHGREFKNIIEPIANNKTLMWVDKEKGLSYLSSASQQVQQEIDNKILSSAANIVRNFENPSISEKKVSNDEQFSVRDANERFNNEIKEFKNKSHKGLMHLGAPSPILKACGVDVDEITLSPKVLNRKLNQHSLTSDDVKDLVNSIQKPIMVYRHGEGTPNIVVITNADIRGNKLSLALELDEDGNVTKLNNVSSIHDKDAEKEVKRWFSWDKGYLENALRWVDKEKVSDWLSSARLNSYSQTEYNQKLSSLAKVLNDFKNPNVSEENLQDNDENVSYSLRQKPEPKKKGIGYKVFYLKDGKLYPPMVANPNGAATPVGVWLDADAAPIAETSKTGRPKVKQGGKGTQGGSGTLAYRPGWHLGVVPYAIQFNRKDAEGNKTLFPKNFVFAEVEYAADVDYQEEAHKEGVNANGKYQHSLAGLKHLPTDGYYMYRTNPNPETDPWVITGAMKVNRLLTRAEQAELVKKAGREPQKIQDGDIVTDEVVNSINQEIASAPKFSLRVYHGTGADFTEFDFEHMGEGAGDQIFGWGGYVTSSKEIGKSYAYLSGMNVPNKDVKYIGDNVNKEADFVSSLFQGGNRTYDDVRKLLQEAYEREKSPYRKRVLDWFEQTQPSDWKDQNEGNRNLYEVNIPDDNGSNYLDFYAEAQPELKEAVLKRIKEGVTSEIKSIPHYKEYEQNFYDNNGTETSFEDAIVNEAIDEYQRSKTVGDFIHTLELFMTPKLASKYLSSLGYTGIKYPAGTIMGGNKKGDMNYVIFKPEDMQIAEHEKFSLKEKIFDPREISDSEKKKRGDILIHTTPVDVAKDQIVKTENLSARKAAEQWWRENVGKPLYYSTEIGKVEINENSIQSSLAHRYGQAKLDAITSLKEGFKNAVYLGTIPDFVRQEGVVNHYFAYPINYDGKRCYVFCRAMEDANKNSLYVHEVFIADNIQKEGNTLQTAAFQPHGGITLYKNILSDVLSATNVDNSSETSKESGEKFSLRLQKAASETETEPTDAQKKSGNYRKGHVKFGGYDYTIENPKGSYRSGVDENGKEWKQKMHDTYGYIRGKFGKDGDHLDMFINDKADLDSWNGTVYIVDQVNKDGSFDEHKVMYGYDSLNAAKEAYLSNYEKGWTGLGNISAVEKADFDKWLDRSNRKLKPFADYTSITSKSDTYNVPNNFEEFLEHPVVRFSIRNESERAAAEDAYNYAQENRPDKYSQYAIVNMDRPGAMPEYMEKKKAADNWRRYYNKMEWGNYKLFDLNKPFEDNVKNLVGKFPNTFRKENNDVQSRINKLTADYNNRLTEYLSMSKNIKIKMDDMLRTNPSSVDVAKQILQTQDYKDMISKYQEMMRTLKQLNELKSGKVADGEKYSLKEVNDKFNNLLDNFTIENADKFVFDLGRPSTKLKTAGVTDKPIRLNGSKLAKKIRKHGFEPRELKNLPLAMENPIAVFDNLGREGNRSVLTELKTANGNFLVTIDLGKGTEADFDVVSSVFGKNGKGVVYWINHNMMKYVDKEKALNYLHLSAPIAEASDNSELSSAANIVRNFENPKKNEEKYSLIGKIGAANLDYEEEVSTRLDNLNVARQMEKAKKDAKAIKMATGWERGADGKWRYEIPDAKLSDMTDIDGKGTMVKRNAEDMLWTSGKLGDKVDAPSLFKAYPELKDVRLETDAITNGMPSEGEYNPKKNIITIHASELKYLNSILNHEIQHAIQHIEGFEHGGNADMFKDPTDTHRLFSNFDKIAKRIFGNTDVDTLYGILDGTTDDYREFVDNVLGEKYSGVINALKEIKELTPKKDFKSQYDEIIKDSNKPSAFEQYMSLAGEVESRNVQRRMDMTPEERRNSLAEETEDVARKDQIFLYGDGERYSLKDVNDRFNDRLTDLIENPNQKDRVLHLGHSSQFLKDGGIADAEIEMDFDKFVRKSNERYKNNHPFSASDIKNLPTAIANPIAVFNSTIKNNHIVLTELKHDGKNFIVAIRATEQKRKGNIVLEVNQITSLYPKGERGIIHWINTNKLSNVDKEKALHFIEALQPHAGTTTGEELSSAANVVRNFEKPKENNEKYSLKDSERKQAQLEIINKTNPMLDDYHTGIRKVEDIKTFEESVDEARQEAEKYDYDEWSAYPDITNDMLQNALDTGEITIYSSKKIKNGVFVTPSYMQASDYAGGGRVYEKTVPLTDVAWINTDEGQYAKVDGERYSLRSDKDAEYLEAVKNGDMGKAQKMVDEAAKAAGYVGGTDYQGEGSWNAPSASVEKKDFANLDAIRESVEEYSGDTNVFGIINGVTTNDDDFYYNPGRVGFRDAAASETSSVLRKLRYEKADADTKVMVYRAVPIDVKGNKLLSGDWIALSKQYCIDHGNGRYGEGNYRIIEEEVPIKTIWNDGNDMREFGYDDGNNNEAEKNVPNNRKLLDAVTYDDNGNVIPLSQRFNEGNNDIRYSLKDSKADRIRKLRESKPVVITGKEIIPSDDLKQYKKNALEYGKSLRGTYQNEDTGELVNLTGGNKRGGIREILQHDYKDIEHLQSIAAIPQIIKKSIFIDELPNEDKEHYPDVKSFRYYVCGLKIGGKDYTVKAVVAEQNNGNRYYDHRLTDIEKGKLLSALPTIQKAGTEGNLPNDSGFDTTSSTKLTTANLSVGKDKRLLSILQTKGKENANTEKYSLRNEINRIVETAKSDGTYMKAPNGKESKLDEGQWAMVRTNNFKKWFGDWENNPNNASKVIDENGEPLVVYHGRSTDFNIFEKKEGVRFIMGLEDKVKSEGFFFTPDRVLAEEFAGNSSRHRGGKANVISCFLNIRRPMDLTQDDYDKVYTDVTGWEYIVGMDTQDNLWGIMDEEGMSDKIKAKGYDGAIFVEEVNDNYEPTRISYCALDANQIKSADKNNGDFSVENNDIRFSLKDSKADRIQKLRESKPVVITGKEYKGKYELNRESAKDWMKNNLRGIYSNKDTGEIIEIRKDGLQKVTSHSMGNTAHLQSLVAIPKLIENSIFIDELPNEKGNGKYDSYRYYVCGLKIGGEDYTVKVTVGVKGASKYYDHALTKIEKSNLLDNIDALSTTFDNKENTLISGGKDTKLISILQTNKENNDEKYSLRVDRYREELNQWKRDNNLPKDAERPQLPIREPNESAADFLKRVKEYRQQAALWATAPTYEQHLLTSDTAQGQFNLEMQRKTVLARITLQDSMLAIRKAQEAIMKEVGVDKLNFAEDAYTAENRSHGKAKNEFEEYNDEFLQPLRKAYNALMQKLGKSYDNVKVYMVAKHGLERNAHIAFKKALDEDYEKNEERMDAYNNYKADIDRLNNDADFEAGRIDFATWKQNDVNIRTKYAPSYSKYRFDEDGNTLDYSGLTALFDADDFESAAADLVKDVEDNNEYYTDELWYATNDATKKILRDSYNAGMMTEDIYNFVRGMYNNYIPLRGWGDTNADQVWNYVGGGKGVFSQVVKEAKGRKSLADDPIAYIENMAESGILMNNRNWVKQHLLLLAENHPTSLLNVSKAWYIKTTDAQGNEEWIPASPQITAGMNSKQVEATLDAFEKKMEQMAQKGDATQKREHLEISYPQTNGEEREHEVRVMKNGEEYVIYINGDPQLAQAMNNTRARKVREGLENSVSQRVIARTGRYMAAAYTSMSPLFIPSNYMRDLTMTLASTAIREDARYNYLLRRNMLRHWNTFPLVLRYQNGTLREKVRNGSASKVEQMFYDFMMNGGETGFVTSLDVEDLKKKFKNDLKDMNRMAANPKKVGHVIMDSIETLNRAIEDSNRFMVYMTSIEYGRSIDEAVNNAKDVTLNFNRKGTGEHGWQTIRNLYLFINPAIQSLQTLGALAKHHPVKFTAVTTTWLTSGVIVPLVNNLLMSFFGGDDDKDKYWQFTKWDRRNNFIMWVPFTHEFVKIPLAQEFRGFYGIGDMIASKLWGGEKAEESWGDYAMDLMGQIVDMLPLDPTGYDGNVAVSLMPNPIRPFFELAFNVDFTGKPLFKDSEYNKYDPNFTKAYVGTPEWLVRISKMVNSIGNDYPDVQQNWIDRAVNSRFNLNNPAVVDHVLSSYLGGAYTMGSQILGVMTKALNGDEIKMADIPLASKFVSNPDDRPVSKKQGDEFWNVKERHDRAANTISKLKKKAKVDGDYSTLDMFFGSDEYKQYKEDDKVVKKYEEDRKKEKAQETGEEYKAHKTTGEDVYKSHATPKDDFEDMKMKQLYEKLNSFKIRYEAIDGISREKGDAYYRANKAAIEAIEEVAYDRKTISDIKKGFLYDGKAYYDADGMKDIRELRRRILEVLERANRNVVERQ